MYKKLIIMIIPVFLMISCGNKDSKTTTQDKQQTLQDIKQETKQQTNQSDTLQEKTSGLKVKSSAFEDNGMIPKKYACNGDDVNPPISWSGAPQGTKSFAMIVDDPDAPSGTVVHWLIYNIPSNLKELAEATPSGLKLANGTMQGLNEKKKPGYMGPCPPDGVHRYYFKVFALDTMLELKDDINKDKLTNAMKGHILAQGQLMGKYTK